MAVVWPQPLIKANLAAWISYRSVLCIFQVRNQLRIITVREDGELGSAHTAKQMLILLVQQSMIFVMLRYQGKVYHVANVPCVLHKGSRPYKNANYLAREGLQLFPQETTLSHVPIIEQVYFTFATAANKVLHSFFCLNCSLIKYLLFIKNTFGCDFSFYLTPIFFRAIPGLFLCIFCVFSNNNIFFTPNVKMIHLVFGTGIQTHDLLGVSILPLDKGSHPFYSKLCTVKVHLKQTIYYYCRSNITDQTKPFRGYYICQIWLLYFAFYCNASLPRYIAVRFETLTILFVSTLRTSALPLVKLFLNSRTCNI